MICIALKRTTNDLPEWLIASGMNMGRWTRYFGVHCLADSIDCKSFVKNIHEQNPKNTLHYFEVKEISQKGLVK